MAYRAGYSLKEGKYMNIPTKITVTRIALVALLLIGLFICSIIPDFVSPSIGSSQINLVYLIACIVFIVASLTDFLDGYLARKWKQVTDLGKFLDPIADKMLVNGLLIFLIFPWNFAPNQNCLVPAFCVILMVIRDLVVDGLRFVAAKKNEVIAANIFGKAKTVAQMIAIPVVLLNGWPFCYFDASWPSYLNISSILVYIATLLSLLSGIIYVLQNKNVLKEKKEKAQ
ncbi:MAG TPA: CDP-diacylglycerol--glycerol-3-phosphate 3-phosphatidyltransferase [Firmicutes bacterium]|nr:CDP-diacylglycerol--glycerol-3-phosphate 3-phosphatidyltransferase [Bacillota bacterium]